jgi:hypothetical protein
VSIAAEILTESITLEQLATDVNLPYWIVRRWYRTGKLPRPLPSPLRQQRLRFPGEALDVARRLAEAHRLLKGEGSGSGPDRPAA